MLGTLSPIEIEEVLRSETLARLGCHAEGRTYVVPVSYAYDGENLIGLSAAGLKLRLMRQNPLVCVQVDHIEDFANWRSVIAWGRFEELLGRPAEAAMSFLHERFRPLVVSATSEPKIALVQPASASEPATAESKPRRGNGHAAIYRIRLYEKTGRFERG